MFLDGVSDTPFLDLLNQIKWGSPYGVMRGHCPLNNLFLCLIPDSDKGQGDFEYRTPPLSGGQLVHISWYKRTNREGEFEVVFRILEITQPS